jgi:hypothetical protein
MLDKKLKTIQLDPMKETADIDESNNFWSADGNTSEATKFQVFKQKQGKTPARGVPDGRINPMQAK